MYYKARGHERQGRRYCVVIQSDRFASSTVIVAMTSTSAAPAIFRPEIEFDGTKTRILADQIYTVAPERLGQCKGSLGGSELSELDRALMLKLGLL
ncbi:type II toxin-antitoxin system PemK/MazF family toxin [Nocardia cyriacigeorgica]|uniref:type II toxin-antitoxin system PemK/MazF family toxin n=1 Tax=Nocardia cyriacigeorgica TaxID=135487 RepID=UPI001895FFC8|nr:type II toxin-antitoxin system PemK/MazF family toxin [Nocardia cyriacigeorgica]MBF6425169.1 type II toxin-antitoxin system PemK/MazF family toxin [Nocardia cyriacigeorgica]